MSSSDSHIYEEIKNLLSKDISVEKVETLISILGSYKPEIHIDRGFQKDLKKSLLTQTHSRKPAFLSYVPLMQKISLVSGVFASFFVLFTFWNILFPHLKEGENRQILLPKSTVVDTPLTINPENKEETLTHESISETKKEKSIQTDAVDKEINAIISDLSDPTIITASSEEKRSQKMESTASVTENSPLARSTVPVSAFSMSMPLSTIDMQASSPPQDTDIQTEISSIISDINSIVSNISINANIILPVYPKQIPVYQKSGTFTDDEILTQHGQNIVTVLMHTEQDTGILIDELRKKAGGKKIKGSGKLVYEVLVKNELTSFLVPKIQFSLVSGKTISVSVVSGME